MEKAKQDAKCPKCGLGEMKMAVPTTPLNDTAETKLMQAHCTQCGFEDDYTKIYPFKK
jgi:DNA-directed RNA polymerase subunit M/transcription elongation factor TFIIS